MNTFIFLECVPAPEWQNKIDFVTKTVLDKENTYILVQKKNIYSPSKDATQGFWSKKSGSPWGGGEFAVNFKITQKNLFSLFLFCFFAPIISVKDSVLPQKPNKDQVLR